MRPSHILRASLFAQLAVLAACSTSTGGGGFIAADASGDAAGGDSGLSFDTGTSADTSVGGQDAAAGSDGVLSDGGAKVCVPTESKACICVTGAMGVQVCKPDQTGWGLCACGPVTDGGGLIDSMGPPDGGPGPGPDGGGPGKDGGGSKDGGSGKDGGGGDGGGGKEACEQLNCPIEWGACQANTGCMALLACKKACKGDKVCGDTCVTSAPADAAPLEKALGDCGKTNGCGGGGGAADASSADVP